MSNEDMSINAMSFILGGLLVTVGLLGGGLEIRELKIPPVGSTTRALAFLSGLAFIALSLYFSMRPLDNSAAASGAAPQQQIFSEPRFGEFRLDVCYEWGRRCGEEPANAWCKAQGFKRAIDYPTENVGAQGVRTKLIGTHEVCAIAICTAFRSITCER